ncbi:DNA-directed primase/polymerase protein isoform X3 [Neltuma alba]|nr:DNA-directed primase/polymerase protein isoform X3 [Prosopis alba]XP_028799503.1 DNA-directed primase/polymerase protein isoform X3 [Prosopis alba]
MSSTAMDDVDRLFACFKCGLSPPQSAVRERKRTKSRLDQGSSTHKISPHSDLLSPKSVVKERKSPTTSTISPSGQAIGVQSSIEKIKSVIAKANGFSHGKHVSPVVFYGSPHGVPPKRPVRYWRLLHEIRLDLFEKNKSGSREEVWVTFPRQDEAMEFAKGQDHVRIFSYQDHFSGQRRFLASTYTEFWRRYKNMDSKLRHHYEVIQEGLPCHLYFDLEFNKRVNPGKDGDEMVDLLITVILEALNEKYFICGDPEWIVEMDSSTDEKFSRHLIMHIPKTAFKDNSHAGAFVSEICSRVRNARGKDERFENLFVKKDSSDECSSQLFVDTAVYSRNRCFRLPLSSKAGKSSVLVPSGRYKCKNLGEEEMFMASLICNMDADCKKYLVGKTESNCVKTLYYDTEVNYNHEHCHQYRPEFTSNSCESDIPEAYFVGRSPFPFLDKFVESIASVGNISGKIRAWYWFSEFGLMVYSMSRNRYCERIGREHKSNHVMYVVDLRSAMYYQKCHDPDCRGYRSPSRPLPVDVIYKSSVEFNSFGMVDNGQSINDERRHPLLNNDQARKSPSYNDNITDSPSGSWWLEALKAVEKVENKQKKTELSTMQIIDDEDEEWWLAVEKTARQVEMAFK